MYDKIAQWAGAGVAVIGLNDDNSPKVTFLVFKPKG